VGISSGSFGGQSLKRYQVDDITSVDVRSAFMTVEMELVISGGSESRRTNAAFTDRMRNENVIMFQKGQLGQVQYVAHIIMDIKQWRRRQARQPPPPQVVHAPAPPTFPEQIRQLAHLKDAGILSAEEFESKKRELLQRM
ncbi:MAG TPA: SHOCT domain-containing protein, partial [Pyrinomonadaceae bacterium]